MRTLRQILQCRSIGILALATLAIALVACDKRASPGSMAEGQEIQWTESPREIRFLDFRSQGRFSFQMTGMDFASEADAQYLTAGWNPLETNESGQGFASTRGESAIIEVPCVTADTLRLSLQVASPPANFDREERLLEIRWNGKQIKPSAVLDAEGAPMESIGPFADQGLIPVSTQPRKLEFEIPADDVLIGDNRIELRSSIWETLPLPDRPWSGKTVGIRCWSLQIASAASRAPIDPGFGPALRVEGNAFLQPPGSVASFYFPLAARARFSALLGFGSADAAIPAPGSAQATLVARGEDGTEQLLCSLDLAELTPAGAKALDVDLSAFDGQSVGFYFAYSVTGDSATTDSQIAPLPMLRWENPRIEDFRNEPQEVAEAEIPTTPRNVVVILFDTLRADFTEPYGGAGTKTPVLADLASKGVVFSNAFSTSSETSPSVVSILSSLYGHEHGFEALAGSVPADIPYLPELLQHAGYYTLGIFGNPRMTPEWGGEGFYRGFDLTHSSFNLETGTSRPVKPDTPEAHAQDIWDRYMQRAIENREKKPFFIFLHELDPHSPYEPLPPYDSMYGHPGGNHHFARMKQGAVPFALSSFGGMTLSEGQIRQTRSLYQGEVSYMDAYLGELLRRLREAGLEENTLVVFLSDHGEAFMEHGMLGHGMYLWDTLLRVPLILSLPGVLPEGARIERDTDLVDLAPLILELVGVEVPDTMRGDAHRSMFWSATAPAHSQNPAFARLKALDLASGSDRWLDSVRYGPWKLIRETRDPESLNDAEYFLFHQFEDPDEAFNLWGQETVVGHALRQMLEHELAGTSASSVAASSGSDPPEDESVSEELLDKLKNLGYLGN